MNRWLGVVLVVCIAAVPAQAALAVDVGGAPPDATPPDSHALLTDSSAAPPDSRAATAASAGEFDRVQFRIQIHENGSAHWTFHYERTLHNDSEREQFRAFAREFNANETQLYVDFRRHARSLVDSGQSQTGRQMEAKAFDRRAQIAGLDENLGVVQMEFVWTNFAVDDGDSLVVSDVFEGGLYIGPSQTLVVETGDEIGFEDVEPTPNSVSGESLNDSDSVTWEGEREFPDNRPRVVLATGADDSVENSSRSSEMPVEEGAPWMALAFGTVVLLGLVAAAAWRRGRTAIGSTSGERAGGTRATAAGTGATESSVVPDEELLTDEDRVENLLKENGGRMKQVNIVEETGWSKSKVSMLLSDMEESGAINKLRVGRENIISLDGHEPDAAGSPHDE